MKDGKIPLWKWWRQPCRILFLRLWKANIFVISCSGMSLAFAQIPCQTNAEKKNFRVVITRKGCIVYLLNLPEWKVRFSFCLASLFFHSVLSCQLFATTDFGSTCRPKYHLFLHTHTHTDKWNPLKGPDGSSSLRIPSRFCCSFCTSFWQTKGKTRREAPVVVCTISRLFFNLPPSPHVCDLSGNRTTKKEFQDKNTQRPSLGAPFKLCNK